MTPTRRRLLAAGTLALVGGCGGRPPPEGSDESGQTPTATETVGRVTVETAPLRDPKTGFDGEPLGLTEDLTDSGLAFETNLRRNTPESHTVNLRLRNTRGESIRYTPSQWRLRYRPSADSRWRPLVRGAGYADAVGLPPTERHTWSFVFWNGVTDTRHTAIQRYDRVTVAHRLPKAVGEYLFAVRWVADGLTLAVRLVVRPEG
ncbi:MAG: hypothetical protein ABEI75_02600 [Halobaculum sp.]